MNEIINRLLLILVIILIALLGYRMLKPLDIVKTPVVTTIESKSFADLDSKEKVESVIKEYLLQNPQVIIESLEQIQNRKVQEDEEKVNSRQNEKKSESEDVAIFPFMGNEKGETLIVFFYDYNCSYCKMNNSYLDQLAKSDPMVKIILKPFPILGDSSTYAAKVALAVNKIDPTKFITIHEGLMRMESITKREVESLIINNQLDYKTIEEEMVKQDIQDILNKNFELADNLKIKAVPASIINNKVLTGVIDLTQFQKIIAEIKEDLKS